MPDNPFATVAFRPGCIGRVVHERLETRRTPLRIVLNAIALHHIM